jgi:hypothetical protein
LANLELVPTRTVGFCCVPHCRALLLPLLTITLMVAVAWVIHPELSALYCVLSALYSALSALCPALCVCNSLI